MTKDEFIHKTSAGPEEYVFLLVNLAAAAADGGNVHRCYVVRARGVEYRWIRHGPSDGSPKVSTNAFGSYHLLY